MKFGYESIPEWYHDNSEGYAHEEDFGITHLKRPDRFPRIHPAEFDSSISLSPASLFPNLPLDIVISIVTEFEYDGSVIRSLECVSRSWRDFFRTPSMQYHYWYKRVLLYEGEFTPTAADWTESADAVRRALSEARTDSSSESGMMVDWRRYYNDARKSPNIKNRGRMYDAVYTLDHLMGNCACSKVCSGSEELE
jgi:hypothetical protein